MDVGQWSGAERRSGTDRRVQLLEFETPERRQAERRRGGVGTHHPDPTEQLLGGIDQRDTLQFEPADGTTGDPLAAAAATDHPRSGAAPGDDAAVSHVPFASERAAIATGLVPEHEPHDAIPSSAAVAGHPLHPVVVPLPIGSFMGALAADVAFAVTRDPFFARAGRLLTLAGVVTGALAALLGGIDFFSRSQLRSHRAAWLHAGGNAATLALGGVSVALRSRKDRDSVVPAGLALSAISGLILLATGWLGGELSYRHRIGLMERERKA